MVCFGSCNLIALDQYHMNCLVATGFLWLAECRKILYRYWFGPFMTVRWHLLFISWYFKSVNLSCALFYGHCTFIISLSLCSSGLLISRMRYSSVSSEDPALANHTVCPLILLYQSGVTTNLHLSLNAWRYHELRYCFFSGAWLVLSSLIGSKILKSLTMSSWSDMIDWIWLYLCINPLSKSCN